VALHEGLKAEIIEHRLGEDYLPGPGACGYCERNAKLLMISATDIPSRGHRECCSHLRRSVLKATEYSQGRLGWISKDFR
jgi:hypothetical protein